MLVPASAVPTAVSAASGRGVVIAGPARVIDGDTLEVASVRIRLEGLDAPERAQQCSLSGRPWPAGEAARRRLVQLVAGQPVPCWSAGRDLYGHSLATCRAGGRDVARTLVREGLAWAFVRYART